MGKPHYFLSLSAGLFVSCALAEDQSHDRTVVLMMMFDIIKVNWFDYDRHLCMIVVTA